MLGKLALLVSFVCLLHQVSPRIHSKQNKVYSDIAGFFKKYRLKVKLEQCLEIKRVTFWIKDCYTKISNKSK